MKGTTTTPYFKFDAGQFLAETMGYPDAVIGLYVRMMALYWESGCSLPEDRVLVMKLGIRTAKDKSQLAIVLEHFFDADRRHPRLDKCLTEAQSRSRQQSENAKKRYEKSDPKNDEELIDF